MIGTVFMFVFTKQKRNDAKVFVRSRQHNIHVTMNQKIKLERNVLLERNYRKASKITKDRETQM